MAFREELDALSQQYVNDSMRGDGVASALMYTEDAILRLNNQETGSIRGRAAIAAFFEQAAKDGYRVHKLTTLRAESSGDLGFATQTYDSTFGSGMVMIALKRDAGAWKVWEEVVIASKA